MSRALPTRLLIAAGLLCLSTSSHADSALRLTSEPATAETDPAWSPDGSWIAYTCRSIDNTDIWKIPSAGGPASRITDDPAIDADPSWSPDGNNIVYHSTRELLPGHGQNLWIKAVGGGGATQITFSSDHDWNPSWSPTGEAICFARGLHTYERTLWQVALAGALESQVVDGVAHTPAWSPDGTRIAFAAKPNGFWHLFVVSAAGGAMIQVTPDLPWSSYVDDPTWSPNGQHIAYLANSQSSPEPQIWIIVATGGTPFQLTFGDGTDKTPAWSPDGNQIAFSSNRQGSADIWVIPVPTTAIEQTSWSVVKQKYKFD